MRTPLACLVFALFLVPLFALSPLPPDAPQPPPPTLQEIWETTDAIVYGRAVRTQVEIAGEDFSPTYDSTLRVERSWKVEIKGDVHIEGGRNNGCYISEPFSIGKTYLVRLQKLPNPDAYTPVDIQEIKLGPDGAPLPLTMSASHNPVSMFGASQSEPRYDESALALLELAERMAGHEAAAKRAYELRTGPKLERERLAREKAEADFLASARADLQRALDTELLADRKTLLLALQERLKERQEEGLDEIKQRITGELSVTETLLSNGIKVRRKIAP